MKVGDVVRLKSGGPDMTVKVLGFKGGPSGPKTAVCEWFDGENLRKDKFLASSIVLVEENPTKA